ncbi:DUF2306 domain-containing protein [Bacillus sp. FJAT-49736]|uniref:DUF2306 domain-containing protein n=1 Tax=Bacillus sp. FJAT-49736 TaxID=2833582 RepID=UPI001BCA6709|nr:DUF2306 domain-containing protein [Bacillus sp. FJAT-49736]MBS4172227.1 DUF2306 domain-containing protein [Bacillus sp. FJAT-49736]
MNKRKISLSILLCYLGILIFLGYILLAYGFNDPRKAGIVSGKFKNPNFSFNTWKIFFYLHIVTGAISLILGPFQFLKKSRKKIHIHRWIGKIYVTSIFLSVPAGIYLAFYATGGIGSTIGFLILDIFWFTTTFIGLKRIRERNIQSHQRWMIRSYAVTLVFVTFRLVLPIVLLIHLGFAIGFPLSVIVSIIINLSLAERYLKKKRKKIAKPDYMIKM